ncbi:glycosyltransferase [Patescibacteria group bacterium AH-259-L07]|nr:glycosyltransferase [Patescibacteria group bacterium AH-259-L07]
MGNLLSFSKKNIARSFKKEVVYNYKKYCKKKLGHALLYYKTDPFLFGGQGVNQYKHTNDWEILEITRILNKLGFWVDIVDRNINISTFTPQDKYDIFIGIGSGNSGKYYPDIAAQLNRAIKIFYATGPEPTLSNELIHKRYEYFYKRHPDKKVQLRRTIDKVDIHRAMELTDAIFCIGNEFAINSYNKFQKPIYRIYPSSSPQITVDISQLRERSPQKFLYFGGHGNIVKGLDLVIEAFADLPNLELYICASEHEHDFNAVYKDILARSSNIYSVGFIPVGDKIFNEITAKCGYIIFPSCSEGAATSVTTCMRRGLVPVVTYESGIDLNDFGYLIKDIHIEQLKTQVQKLSKESKSDLTKKSIKSYLASFNYTQAKFSESLEKALIDVLVNKDGA